MCMLLTHIYICFVLNFYNSKLTHIYVCKYNVHKIYIIDINIYTYFIYTFKYMHTYKSLHFSEPDATEPANADDVDDNAGEEATTKRPNHSAKDMTIALGDLTVNNDSAGEEVRSYLFSVLPFFFVHTTIFYHFLPSLLVQSRGVSNSTNGVVTDLLILLPKRWYSHHLKKIPVFLDLVMSLLLKGMCI